MENDTCPILKGFSISSHGKVCKTDYGMVVKMAPPGLCLSLVIRMRVVKWHQ